MDGDKKGNSSSQKKNVEEIEEHILKRYELLNKQGK